MMKIKSKDKWSEVDEKGYMDEEELQKILGASPHLIPVGELGGGRKPILVAVREGGLPGSGSTDLIGVDENGNITVVETKLAKNEEIKRKVIGQILEYAAYLWQKPFDEFSDIFYQKLGSRLIDCMEKAEKENKEWSAEEFRDAVEANLKNGAFALFIVVDEINEELRRIIEFLKSKNFVDFGLHALELKYFEEKETSFIIPQLYGAESRSPKGPKGPVIRDEASYFANARKTITDKQRLDLLTDLYGFSKENADYIRFGQGGVKGNIRFEVNRSGTDMATIPIFQLKSDGTVKVNFWGIAGALPGGRGKVISDELRKRLFVLPGIKSWYEKTEQRIAHGEGKKNGGAFLGENLPLNEVFPDDSSLAIFKSAILDAKKEIQRGI